MTSSSRATTSRAAVSWRGWGSPTPPRRPAAGRPGAGRAGRPLRRRLRRRLVDALGAVADPDLALLGLVRLMEALRRLDDDGQHSVARARRRPAPPRPGQDRLLAVLGSSRGPRRPPGRPPRPLARSVDRPRRGARRGERRDELGRRRRPRSGAASGTAYDALRVAYRRELLGIAALDLDRGPGGGRLPETAAALADLAGAALEAALAIARRRWAEAADALPARRHRHGQVRRPGAELRQRRGRDLRGRARGPRGRRATGRDGDRRAAPSSRPA